MCASRKQIKNCSMIVLCHRLRRDRRIDQRQKIRFRPAEEQAQDRLSSARLRSISSVAVSLPRMRQRRGASGQASGTDGSDFSCRMVERMVVDSRYQRFAEGRSRLGRLILVQALYQLVGGAFLLLSLSKGVELNKFAVLSVAAGLLAIWVGELGDVRFPGLLQVVLCFIGRRRIMAALLRMYTSLSSIAIAFSVTCIIRSELFLKVTEQNMAAITSYELVDTVHVALGVLLQLVVIATTNKLLQDMCPPKRASHHEC